MTIARRLRVVLVFSLVAGAAGGCSQVVKEVEPVRAPLLTGEPVDAGGMAAGEVRKVTLSNGVEISVQKISSKIVFPVEGALSDTTFQQLQSQFDLTGISREERRARMSQVVGKVLARLRAAGAMPVGQMSQNDEVGYFSFLLPYDRDLFGTLKDIQFDRGIGIVVNPVVYDAESLKQIRSLSPQRLGLPEPAAFSSADRAYFSGLRAMKVPEFVTLAESDIGASAKVDGSGVKLGITDTGITHRHSTFLSGDRSKNRITYMKDFTGEGAVYFSPSAKFSVLADPNNPEDLLVSGDVIVTPRLPAVPLADDFASVSNLRIKVSPELKTILTTPGNGARLGVLTEWALGSDAEPVDLNRNGKTTDQFLCLFVPGTNPAEDTVYFDVTATGDFRRVKGLRDWNTTKSMIRVYSEEFGFSMQSVKLPNKTDGAPVAVRSANIVGFDPGNHGSHVAGIAAGSRTILNDSSDTLARGVAPEAEIQMNRVCSNNAGCSATQAIVDLATQAHSQVVNMSLGGLSPFNDGYGVQETIINRLTDFMNTLFVISAGNSGPGHQTVGSPSTARLALSVGASASRAMIQRQYGWPGEVTGSGSPTEDMMLFFSSRGPTAAGGFKPNLAAPGTELSAVQLNAAPGLHAGLDVYWGTSMAAPAATGASALLLDAIQKYNAKHPEKPLPTRATIIRQVLIDSARPFDVNRFDPQSGERTNGQYTWIDQGTGMLDLVAAWKKLKEMADQALPTAVNLNGADVELDYQVMTLSSGPNGVNYDGSRPAADGSPAFATGLYLNFNGKDTLRPVYIQRKLPAAILASADAGEAEAQLNQTQDEFVLKTVFYGSDKVWLKAGVRDELNCWNSSESSLILTARGVDVDAGTGGARLNPVPGSTLNVCVNRELISKELTPGDHGALIYGYRTVAGKVSPVASFIVPVYLTVPHRTLALSQGFSFSGEVQSFGVKRNYVVVPKGVSLVRVSIEVPAFDGTCSGIELMSLEGDNVTKSFSKRADARIQNCKGDGTPLEEKGRKIVFTRSAPKSGVWNLDIFGQYRFAKSKYQIMVDYVNSSSSQSQITGGTAVLKGGSLTWKIQDASMPVIPSEQTTAIRLSGLQTMSRSEVEAKSYTLVPSPNGVLRSYSPEVKSVIIQTGGSPGNDIDLMVLECPQVVKNPEDSACQPKINSGGATDEEMVRFVPQPDKLYVVRVDGFEVKGDGKFLSLETLLMTPEHGEIKITGAHPEFQIGYRFNDDQLKQSKLLQHSYFTSGKYWAVGRLEIRDADGADLDAIPVKISQ